MHSKSTVSSSAALLWVSCLQIWILVAHYVSSYVPILRFQEFTPPLPLAAIAACKFLKQYLALLFIIFQHFQHLSTSKRVGRCEGRVWSWELGTGNRELRALSQGVGLAANLAEFWPLLHSGVAAGVVQCSCCWCTTRCCCAEMKFMNIAW